MGDNEDMEMTGYPPMIRVPIVPIPGPTRTIGPVSSGAVLSERMIERSPTRGRGLRVLGYLSDDKGDHGLEIGQALLILGFTDGLPIFL